MADERKDDDQQEAGGPWAPFGPRTPDEDEEHREQHPPPQFQPPSSAPPGFQPPAGAAPPGTPPPTYQGQPAQGQSVQQPGYGAPQQGYGYGAPPQQGYGYGPPPPGYGPPPPGYGTYGAQPYVAKKTNGFAVASLILGALWLYWIGSVLALIFGYIGKSQIDNSGDTQEGRGLAVAGIVLGWVGVAVLAIIIVVALATA